VKTRNLALSAVAAVAITGCGAQASAAPAPPPPPPPPCPAGMYGLAGDWGPGSLLAHTPANVALMRRRYGWGAFAWHVIHNVRPRRCS
jgi:hypothetical protein